MKNKIKLLQLMFLQQALNAIKDLSVSEDLQKKISDKLKAMKKNEKNTASWQL